MAANSCLCSAPSDIITSENPPFPSFAADDGYCHQTGQAIIKGFAWTKEKNEGGDYPLQNAH